MECPSQTLVHALQKHILVDPHRPAFITDGGTTTFGELAQRIASTVDRLLSCGIKKGNRVLLMGPNHDDLAVAYFAIHSVSAIAVPVDPSLKADELEFIVNDSTPSLALVEKRQKLPVRQEHIERFTLADDSNLCWKPTVNLEDEADILYTTGTTARKKGVLLTHVNIAAAALNISRFVQNSKSDLEILPIPLSHSFGLGRLRSMALVGNMLFLEPGLRNPAFLLKRILDLRADGVALVPAGFELMLGLTRGKLAEAQDHLKYIEIGSAPIRNETKRKLMELLPNTRICHHYGLTEASRACFRELHTDSHKPQSIGKPSPNVKISIVNSNGRSVGVGETGEIVIHGAMTMKQYWNRPDLDSKSFFHGGFRSGDIGNLDEDGYVYLRGRKSDIINVGGLKIAPPEVESAVLSIKAIKDCACVGVPDHITGEKVKLFYVSDNDLEIRVIIKQLRSRLEEYKIPKLFERIETIPKTVSGKIQRHLLKAVHRPK